MVRGKKNKQNPGQKEEQGARASLQKINPNYIELFFVIERNTYFEVYSGKRNLNGGRIRDS